MLVPGSEYPHLYRLCREKLVDLPLTPGQSYQTPATSKVRLPVVNDCYGLNVLGIEDHPEVTKSHEALLRLSLETGVLTARYFATGSIATKEYLRPGILHNIGDFTLRQLVEPGIYDGYQITIPHSGEIRVEGITEGQLVPLPIFEEFPDSAGAFGAATHRTIEGLVGTLQQQRMAAS